MCTTDTSFETAQKKAELYLLTGPLDWRPVEIFGGGNATVAYNPASQKWLRVMSTSQGALLTEHESEPDALNLGTDPIGPPHLLTPAE